MTKSFIAAAAVAFLIAAPVASAADNTVTGGSADWGVKQSFRNYVTGPIASGSYKAEQGASRNSDGTIHFEPASGTYDPTGAGKIMFGGSVFFTGHAGQLQLRITDPRVEYQGNTGTLFADVSSKSLDTGEVEEFPNTDFAKLDLTGVATTDDGSAATSGPIPMKLTANGAKAFGGNYEEGEELDPISLKLTYAGGTAVEAGTIKPGKKKQAVTDSDPLVSLAKVGCQVAECDVVVPAKLSGTIVGGDNDGAKVKAKVLAPATLESGVKSTIEAKLKKSAAELLAGGGKLKLSAEIELSAGSLSVSEVVGVKVTGR